MAIDLKRIDPGLDWPNEHLVKLVQKVGLQLPEIDMATFRSRLIKMDWSKVAFEEYSSDDCQQMYMILLKKIRKYRLLGEINDEIAAWLECPTNLLKRPIRHLDKPKRPPTMPTLLMKDLLKKTTLRGKELMRLVGEKYRNLSVKKREKYEKIILLAKEEYDRQMITFKKNHPELEKKKKKREKKPKIETPIQYSSYKLYLDDKIKEAQTTSDQPLEELIKTYQEKWENMTTEEKLPWYKTAKKEDRNAKRAIAKSNKPKRRMSAYSYFFQQTVKSEKFINVPRNQYMKDVSLLWKKLTPKEKEEWTKKWDLECGNIETTSKGKSTKKRKTIETDESADELRKNNAEKEDESKLKKNKVGAAKKRKIDEIDGFSNTTKEELIVKEDSPSEYTSPEKKNLSKNKKKKIETDHLINGHVIDDTIKEESFVKFSSNQMSTPKVSKIPPIEDGLSPKKKKKKDDPKIEDTLRGAPKPPHEIEDGRSPKKKKKKEETKIEEILARAPKPPPEEAIKIFKSKMKKQKVKYASQEQLQDAWSSLPSEERKTFKKECKRMKKEYAAQFEQFFLGLSEKEQELYSKSQNIAYD